MQVTANLMASGCRPRGG